MGCGPSTTIVVTPTDEAGPASTKHGTQAARDGRAGSPDPIVSLSLHPQRFYTLRSIAAAANAADAPVLTVISGLVYDVTQFLPTHPGGEDLLRQYGAGQDCTLWFSKPPSDERPFAHVHGKTSWKMLERMKVGWIVSDTDPRAGRSLEDVEADEGTPKDHRGGKAVGSEQQRAAADDSEIASGQRGHAYVHSRDETSAASTNHAYQSSSLRMQALHRIKQVERQQHSKHTHNASAASAVSLPGMVSSAPQVSVLQAYSRAEIESHATQHDCWTIAQRHQVFDVTSLVTTVPPLFDWRRTGGKDSSSYLASKFSEEQITAFLAPLHVGFVEGHSLQIADLARVPSGTRGGSMAGPNGGGGAGGGPRRSSNSFMSTADTNLDSAAARAALDAITNDDLTIAASEGLLPAPNSTRYLWRLVGSRDLTHDTKLLTFDPVVAPRELADYKAHLSEDDRELAERFPVVYSSTPLRPGIAHHISVEIPFVLPVENQAERAQRERENRPLDVPFRMQRSYTPLDAGPLIPRSAQMQLLVKSYPKIAGAHGSEYMHSLRVGDVMVSTGARSRFDFDALATARSDDSPKYDFWVCLVAGSGIAAIYGIIRELLRRCVAAQTAAAAAAAAAASSPEQHVRGRSHSSRAPSSDSTIRGSRCDSFPAAAPCKRIVLIYCSRSEEDIILGPELDALVEAHPGLFSVFHVLSQPLFSPKASSFSGRLSAELLRIVLPPALQPSATTAEAITVGGLLGAGAIPGSRPRSPVNAQARPNVQDLHARVVAAQEVVRAGSGASSLHGSPLMVSQGPGAAAVVPNIAAIMANGGGSGTNSRPGSRPRSPARFHFNIPTRATPPIDPSPSPPPTTLGAIALAQPQPIVSSRSTLSVVTKSSPPFAPSSAPGSPMPMMGENLLHVPDGLKTMLTPGSSDGAGDSLASSHRGSHVPANANGATGSVAFFQRVLAASGTGSGSGSARGPRTTALALVCGPIEFNGAALGLLAKFGFKRGLGNMNGKDVHLF